MIANLSLHPDMYHLYFDLNKAFNSVPRRALWQILSNYNIPHSIINLIQNLYACTHDFPVVNGFALFAANCIRGLRQGCPMSPILYNLFVDPIINNIQSLLPKHEFNDLFSFIDDIALQTTSHATLHTVLHFFFVQGPRYGLPLTLQSPNSTPSTTPSTSPFVLVLPNISVLLPTMATPGFFINTSAPTFSTNNKTAACSNLYSTPLTPFSPTYPPSLSHTTKS